MEVEVDFAPEVVPLPVVLLEGVAVDVDPVPRPVVDADRLLTVLVVLVASLLRRMSAAFFTVP